RTYNDLMPRWRRASPSLLLGGDVSPTTACFGRRRLDQITVDDIAAFIAAMTKKKLKSSTITTALRPLSRLLAQAARKDRSRPTRWRNSNTANAPAATTSGGNESSASRR